MASATLVRCKVDQLALHDDGQDEIMDDVWLPVSHDTLAGRGVNLLVAGGGGGARVSCTYLSQQGHNSCTVHHFLVHGGQCSLDE